MKDDVYHMKKPHVYYDYKKMVSLDFYYPDKYLYGLP